MRFFRVFDAGSFFTFWVAGIARLRMLYISYGSVCELEIQILLAGDLDLIKKGELGTVKKDIAEIARMLKSMIKSLENNHLNP